MKNHYIHLDSWLDKTVEEENLPFIGQPVIVDEFIAGYVKDVKHAERKDKNLFGEIDFIIYLVP